ncbi:hypothetical protein INS49_004081 [Diaporthe citri]|uniref:uncharacterized protein n=1 Tax=Diaporthe citri TaxID=83186 RepID=UPI001C7E834F|nr:uncharacterized protein INS49_004081 [Diaporthe citri]KAG6355000.1 hypothetical protein INS49_004081 [Diaporthe citri]
MELRGFRAPRLWDEHGSFGKLSRYFGDDRVLASLYRALKLVARIGSLRWDDGNSIHKGKKPVLESITEAKVSYATDPRDKVYGILAFLPPTIASRIQPDYDTGFTWQACWTIRAELRKIEVGPPDIKIDEDVRGTSDQFGIFDFKVVNGHETSRNGVSWAEVSAGSILPYLYRRVLHANESFELQGIPLMDYFTSRTEYCKKPRETKEAIFLASELLMWRRLFQTENGFIGSITRHAVPGVKIAILYNCDMPVVLRPSAQGDTYEVVGGCFVEGYMKGELVEDIKSGKFKTETFCLI